MLSGNLSGQDGATLIRFCRPLFVPPPHFGASVPHIDCSMFPRSVFLGLLSVALYSGCAGGSSFRVGQVVPVQAPNPLFVATSNEDYVWERMVETLEDFQLPIHRENRQSRVIETEYKVGASVFEPWHKDSVGFSNRLESTLQSVRRRVVMTMIPSDEPTGYSVNVVAYKEFEDLPGIAANSPGGATFLESKPLDRDLNQVVGQSAPSGWMWAGRDYQLEQSIVGQLSFLLTR